MDSDQFLGRGQERCSSPMEHNLQDIGRGLLSAFRFDGTTIGRLLRFEKRTMGSAIMHHRNACRVQAMVADINDLYHIYIIVPGLGTGEHLQGEILVEWRV